MKRARAVLEAESAKDFLKRKLPALAHGPRKKGFLVMSSGGEFEVDKDGTVLSWNPADEQGAADPDFAWCGDVVKFDISEFVSFWVAHGDKRSDLVTTPEIDDLDIGFWKRDGTYEPANKDFRQDIIDNMGDDDVIRFR